MKILTALVMASILCVMGAVGTAGAATATQGDFALALAQILGFDATAVDAATSVLQQKNVFPQAGWVPGAPLSLKTITELRSSLKQAVKSGRSQAGPDRGRHRRRHGRRRHDHADDLPG